ncbi:MAG: DUF362 domain-containing protein [Candidatus Aminicenantes bacterium]|nr:DUF362 domain-containing protein [Candidatus Aminicenantes bacterium]
MDHDEILELTGDKNAAVPEAVSRRGFFKLGAAGAAGFALSRTLQSQDKPAESKPPAPQPADIKTNVDEIRAIPRTKDSMPGKFPGRVVKLDTGPVMADGKVDAARVEKAVARGMAELTGESDPAKAWSLFVTPQDVVGIKINPIGGKTISTKPEVVDAVIAGLRAAGVPKANIVIWDRRLHQMLDAGFTAERFPGIALAGTEMRGPNNDFYDEAGELWAKDNIDRGAKFYFADLEMAYNKNLLAAMINQGKESYFTKLVTQKVTKVINVPVLKNSGGTVTLCLKNLAYGALSNTSRLHKIWAKSVAEPNGFPYLRDKVVLNIVDALQAQYDKGPGANPQFVYDAGLMMFGTDPVAVDAVAHEYLVKVRVEKGVQQFDVARNREYLDLAAGLSLGVASGDKINLAEVALG